MGDSVMIQLDVTVTLRGEEITLQGERWPVSLENNVWRIKPSEQFIALLEGIEDGEE